MKSILWTPILLALSMVLSSCEEEVVVVQEKRSYKGDVEVLNSCGIVGAADAMKQYLRENGFDVVSVRNDVLRNYEETIIVLRNPEWEGAQALAKALHTDNVMTVISKRSVEDAVVYLGKDFRKLIEPEKVEEK